jgi:guanylate kinase
MLWSSLYEQAEARFVPMRGLILTGALGVGKTTAQDTLVRLHGFWTPTTMTTRSVSSDEAYALGVGLEEFTAGVRDRRFVLPAKFGTNWYGWSAEDFHRLRNDRAARAVVNVRPYTALLLSALIEDMLPVWIWLTPEELALRLAQRAAVRDVEPAILSERRRQDEEDRTYETLFEHRVRSDENMPQSLLRLIEST